MSALWQCPDKRLENRIINFCRDIAGSCEITTIAIVGDYTSGLQVDRKALQVLAVIPNFQPRLVNRVTSLAGRNIVFSAVDKWVFERDVEMGLLGEALAQKLVFPYLPLTNRDYLRVQEVRLKKRLVLEILKNLVLDFPELSYDLHIKPEYFMYQTLLGGTPLFPPLSDNISNFLQEKFQARIIQRVMEGYLAALKELEEEKLVAFSDRYVKINKEFAENVEDKKTSLRNLFRTTRRTLFNSVFGIFLKTLGLLSPNRNPLNLHRGRKKKLRNHPQAGRPP